MNVILRAVNVKRVFGSGNAAVQVLNGVNLNVPRNSLVALKGRSGSGKTTLLNILGALDKPTEGEVYLEDEEIAHLPERRRDELRRCRMGFVFQAFALVPLMSAAENVEFGLRIAGVPQKEWKRRTEEALDLVGLTKRARHRPFEMSGGEQQRCAIARAIAHQPQIIFADEPTGELDSKMAMQVMKVFRALVEQKNLTILMTTHDPAIIGVADHVYELEDGQVSGATDQTIAG
jgi:putative ABC transport system ATP-binding protein